MAATTPTIKSQLFHCGYLTEGGVAIFLMFSIDRQTAESLTKEWIGIEIMGGDPDKQLYRTGVGVVSNLLKNRFSSQILSLTPKAGMLQPVMLFIPFHTSFIWSCLGDLPNFTKSSPFCLGKLLSIYCLFSSQTWMLSMRPTVSS